jgi:rhodanese-related sulfurtransferase
MATAIGTAEVRGMVDAGALLVEVLPAEEFEEMHLPGARSIPLRRLNEESTADLDRNRALIVYCWDYL